MGEWIFARAIIFSSHYFLVGKVAVLPVLVVVDRLEVQAAHPVVAAEVAAAAVVVVEAVRLVVVARVVEVARAVVVAQVVEVARAVVVAQVGVVDLEEVSLLTHGITADNSYLTHCL